MSEKRQLRMYRQGDVLIREVDSVPEGLEPWSGGRIVLAEGEATGHAHAIEDAETQAWVGEKDAVWFEVRGLLTEVRHEEHDTIELPPGRYVATRQREYSPEAIRNVAD